MRLVLASRGRTVTKAAYKVIMDQARLALLATTIGAAMRRRIGDEPPLEWTLEFHRHVAAQAGQGVSRRNRSQTWRPPQEPPLMRTHQHRRAAATTPRHGHGRQYYGA